MATKWVKFDNVHELAHILLASPIDTGIIDLHHASGDFNNSVQLYLPRGTERKRVVNARELALWDYAVIYN